MSLSASVSFIYVLRYGNPKMITTNPNPNPDHPVVSLYPFPLVHNTEG